MKCLVLLGLGLLYLALATIEILEVFQHAIHGEGAGTPITEGIGISTEVDAKGSFSTPDPEISNPAKVDGDSCVNREGAATPITEGTGISSEVDVSGSVSTPDPETSNPANLDGDSCANAMEGGWNADI